MNFYFLLIVLIIISTTAALADRFVMSCRLEPFRKELAAFWEKFQSPGASELTQSMNSLFCNFFDLIYGPKLFSRRRLVSSCISSIGAYLILFLIGYLIAVNIYGTESLSSLGVGHLVWSLLVVGAVNLVPDFISLAETRLVLKWSRNRGLIGVIFFIVLDLIATFFVLIFVGTFISLSVISAFESNLLGESLPGMLSDALIDLSMSDLSLGVLVSIATTFFTSFFWICFVICYCFTRIAYKLFPLTKYLYEQISQSDKPVTAIAGFANVLVTIGWCLTWGISVFLNS